MKKFLAVFLLMVYGFTSIGASVAVHQCSVEREKAHHHHSSGASSCSHGPAHLTADCGAGNVQVCTAIIDDTLSEAVSVKPFNLQPALTSSFYPDEEAALVALRQTIAPLTSKPSGLHKIRLHLYNRILLI